MLRTRNRIRQGLATLTGIDKDLAKQLAVGLPAAQLPGASGRLGGYKWAILTCLVASLLALPMRGSLDLANIVMVYLLAVVLVAVRFGLGPGVAASVLSVFVFGFFLVPPYQSLTVEDTQYLFMLGIMFAVAVIISSLAANLRRQVTISHYREQRAHELFELSKALSAALTNEQIAAVASHHANALFQAGVVLLLPDMHGKLQPADTDDACASISPVAIHSAQAIFDSQPLSDPDSVKFSGRVLFLPLRAPTQSRGVLLIMADDPRRLFLPEQQRLLQICATQIALALERQHFVEAAQDALVAVESERLRNALLSAVSHDVRTPLTAIIGLSSTLAEQQSTLSGKTRTELIEAIQDEAFRMNKLVTNLLDMGRLRTGGVKLNRQWQMLEEVVGSALGQLSRALNDRKVELALASTLPLLNFDAVLIERLLCNLLDNAIKYSNSATPIRIAAVLDGDEVLVSVEDCGTGVPVGLEKAIFEKFTQANPESTLSGAGLGLSICRAIIQAHGGRIGVDEHYPPGARFWFTLPLGSPPSYEEGCTEANTLNRTGSA